MTSTAGGHGVPRTKESGRTTPAEAPKPARYLNTYRVRPGGREGVWYIWEHRGGKVEIYGRLVGAKAEARARAIAKDANGKEGAA